MQSVVILKTNPVISKCGGGCVERESYLEFGNRIGMRKIRNTVKKKKMLGELIYMDMDQKAREVVEKVDSCRDGCELFRTAKGLGKERCC